MKKVLDKGKYRVYKGIRSTDPTAPGGDMRKNVINIVAADIQFMGTPNGSIEEKLGAYIQATRDHWIAPTDAEKLQAAIMVTILNTDNEGDKARLLTSWAMVLKVSEAMDASAAGVPVNYKKMVEENEGFEAIQILKIWHENK